MWPQTEFLIRVIVGTVLGGIIGYERDLHGRPAGLRTHMIVALASAMFMVISTQFVHFQNYTKDDLISVDASRIAASIVTGIGFLAGGAILRTGATVKGLTTAAGLWLVAAIGMAAGAGMYVMSVFATALGVAALTMFRRFEDKDDTMAQRTLALVLDEQTSMVELSSSMKQLGIEVSAIDYDRHLDDRKLSVTLDIRFPHELTIEKVLEQLESRPGVKRVRMSPAAT